MLPVDLLTLLAFIPAGLALNLTPGADMMFCLGQGLKSGRRPAMAANFGIATGGMIHTLLAALGLGALVAAHPAAFEAIRWLGVGYLLWLAVAALRSSPFATEAQVTPTSTARAFWQGLMVNLLNPKVILRIEIDGIINVLCIKVIIDDKLLRISFTLRSYRMTCKTADRFDPGPFADDGGWDGTIFVTGSYGNDDHKYG